MGLQRIVRLAFPPQCLSCNAFVAEDFALCGACWSETPFIQGAICDLCGTPLPGEASDEPEICDDCTAIARPWTKGRAVFEYSGTARKIVLSLKHGDRLELARPAAQWLLRAGHPVLDDADLLIPVPTHRTRLLYRRYNQAAILARALANITSARYEPGCLQRVRRTPPQHGKSLEIRFSNLSDAISATDRAGDLIAGQSIVLIDDVMTSGATLAACAEAAWKVGARNVQVLTLARAVKDPYIVPTAY